MGLAWDLRAHFLCVPKFMTRWVKKNILNLGLKGVMEMCGLFTCIPILGVFIFLKKRKRGITG